jgi:hypothetical protein
MIGEVTRYYYNERYPNTEADAIRVHLPKASLEFITSGEVTRNRFNDKV